MLFAVNVFIKPSTHYDYSYYIRFTGDEDVECGADETHNLESFGEDVVPGAQGEYITYAYSYSILLQSLQSLFLTHT